MSQNGVSQIGLPQTGLTLLELLITLIIVSIILAFALPGFDRQVQQTRAKTTANELYQALQAARARAVSINGRATLRAKGDWNQGWMLFDDLNHNGVRDPGEAVLLEHRTETPTLQVSGNQPVQRYVSFVGTGESRYATGSPGGAFQAGTLTICPRNSELGGYQLVLSRMGRVRTQAIEAEDCAQG